MHSIMQDHYENSKSENLMDPLQKQSSKPITMVHFKRYKEAFELGRSDFFFDFA